MSNVITLKVELEVHVHVAEEFPATAEQIAEGANCVASDYRSGRYPLAVELAAEGAERLIRAGVERALFEHVCEALPDNEAWQVRKERTENLSDRVRFIRAGEITSHSQVKVSPKESEA